MLYAVTKPGESRSRHVGSYLLEASEGKSFQKLGEKVRLEPLWLERGKRISGSRSYAGIWRRNEYPVALFDEPGRYFLKVGYPYGDSDLFTQVEFNVIPPPAADVPIVALLREDAALRRAIVSKTETADADVCDRLEKLVAKYPRSTYSDYARFALARAALAAGDKPKARKLLEQIDADYFPHGPQVLLALSDLLSPDEAEARTAIARKLAQQYPHAVEVAAAEAAAMTDEDWKALRESIRTPTVPKGVLENHPLWRHRSSSKGIATILFSPAGDLVTCDTGGRIHFWDWDKRRSTNTVCAASQSTSLAFLPDGKSFLSGSHDKTVRLWSVKQQSEVNLMEMDGRIDDIATSHDGTCFAVEFLERGKYPLSSVAVWDLHTKKIVREIKGHRRSIHGIGFSPNGRWLASASFDHFVLLTRLNADDADSIVLKQSEALFNCLDFSPDSKLLATGTYRGNVWLWDVETGKEFDLLRGHKRDVWALKFSPDGRFLATGGPDRCAKLWDVVTRKEIAVLHAKEGIRSLAFTPNGRSLLGGEVGGHLVEWDLSDWYPVED